MTGLDESQRSGRPGRKAEATRQLLIDTALAMLHEQGPSAGVRHIHLQDVVTRAGLTVGAAYPHWRRQETFQHDLAIAAVRWRDKASTQRTYTMIKQVFEAGGPLSEVLRLGSEGNLQKFPEDIAFLTTIALRASALGNPKLVAASSVRHSEAMAAFADLYSQVMQQYKRKMRHPFTIDHLAALFAALMEGFAMQTVSGEDHPRVTLQVSDPEIAGNQVIGRDWTLLAVAVVALVDRLTEPEM